jgi:hypothetical protein
MNLSELAAEVETTIQVYEELIEEYAARTRDMIERYGHVAAIERLMISPDLQRGFRVLRDRGRLWDSFESLVAANEDLFSGEAVEAARWRLDNADELL